jgi:hypothetical protein
LTAVFSLSGNVIYSFLKHSSNWILNRIVFEKDGLSSSSLTIKWFDKIRKFNPAKALFQLSIKYQRSNWEWKKRFAKILFWGKESEIS